MRRGGDTDRERNRAEGRRQTDRGRHRMSDSRPSRARIATFVVFVSARGRSPGCVLLRRARARAGHVGPRGGHRRRTGAAERSLNSDAEPTSRSETWRRARGYGHLAFASLEAGRASSLHLASVSPRSLQRHGRHLSGDRDGAGRFPRLSPRRCDAGDADDRAAGHAQPDTGVARQPIRRLHGVRRRRFISRLRTFNPDANRTDTLRRRCRLISSRLP